MSGLEIETENLGDALYVHAAGYGEAAFRVRGQVMRVWAAPERLYVTWRGKAVAEASAGSGLYQVKAGRRLVRLYVNCTGKHEGPDG